MTLSIYLLFFREFIADDDKNTIWGSSYEESTHAADLAATSSTIHQTPKSIELTVSEHDNLIQSLHCQNQNGLSNNSDMELESFETKHPLKEKAPVNIVDVSIYLFISWTWIRLLTNKKLIGNLKMYI